MRLLTLLLPSLLAAACATSVDLDEQASTENDALLGYNVIDVGKYPFYAQRTSPDNYNGFIDVGEYKYPNTRMWVLVLVYANDPNWPQQLDAAVHAASAKGDQLVIRLDFQGGTSVPYSSENRDAFLDAAIAIASTPGVRFVQVGNEPNVFNECEATSDHRGCTPQNYAGVVRDLMSRPGFDIEKFLFAPASPFDARGADLMDRHPATWISEALDSLGACPRYFGLHSYGSYVPGEPYPQYQETMAKVFREQLLEINIDTIRDFCPDARFLVTETNTNASAPEDDVRYLAKIVRTTIDELNSREPGLVLGALFFMLGDPGYHDPANGMTKFFVSQYLDEGKHVMETVMYCGQPGGAPACIDEGVRAKVAAFLDSPQHQTR